MDGVFGLLNCEEIYHDNNSCRIGLIDYGQVKRIPEAERLSYAQLIRVRLPFYDTFFRFLGLILRALLFVGACKERCRRGCGYCDTETWSAHTGHEP